MNVCISLQSLLEQGSWICFAVHTNCWGVGSNVECVDIFASQALIQKARNWKHLGVVIVEFQQESCTFHKSMWHFFLCVCCFEVMKNTMYFHALSYSLNQLFLGAQFTEKDFFWHKILRPWRLRTLGLKEKAVMLDSSNLIYSHKASKFEQQPNSFILALTKTTQDNFSNLENLVIWFKYNII